MPWAHPYRRVDALLIQDSFMTEKVMPLSQALQGYELFDSMKVQKGERIRERRRPQLWPPDG
jgi:hypothetical protein